MIFFLNTLLMRLGNINYISIIQLLICRFSYKYILAQILSRKHKENEFKMTHNS